MNRPARSGPRPATAGNSAGAKGAFLLAVAAILGIILLQAFDDGGSSVGVGVGNTTIPSGATGGATATTLPPAQTVPTVPASRAPADVIVLVANGTGIKGLGSQNADALKALGYNTLTAVDATRVLDASTVQYVEGYQPEARAVGLTLGLPASAVVPLNSPPVSDTQGANVFVLLGGAVAGAATTTVP